VEPAALQLGGDACRSAERIDGGAGPDAAVLDDFADEAEQLRFVTDVSHVSRERVVAFPEKRNIGEEDLLRYRVAVRYTDERQRYHVEDIEADSMADALRAVEQRVAAGVLATADLVEIRPQIEGDTERSYSSG
jgi:hypothetical protein